MRRPVPEVEAGDLPAEEAEEERERDLVDHRGGDEERERHAERDAGRDEPDEHRDRRAGAERRDDAEEGSQDVSGRLAPPREQAARLLRREEAPHDADDEDDERQEQEDLRDLVDEELDCGSQVCPGRQAKQAIGEELREGAVGGIGADPGGERREVEQDGPAPERGGRRGERGGRLGAERGKCALRGHFALPGASPSSRSTSGTRTSRISSRTRRKTGSASSPSPAWAGSSKA